MGIGGLGQPNHKPIVDAEGNPVVTDINSMSFFAVFVCSLVFIAFALYFSLGDILPAMIRLGISIVISISITIVFGKWTAKKLEEKRRKNEIKNRSIAAKFEEKQIEERRKRTEKIDKVYK